MAWVIAEHVIGTRFPQRRLNGLIKVVAVTEVASARIAGNRFQGVVRGESLEGFGAHGAIGVDAEVNLTLSITAAEAWIPYASRRQPTRINGVCGHMRIVQQIDGPPDLIAIISFRLHGAGRISHYGKREPG